jgi:hypothetical protein
MGHAMNNNYFMLILYGQFFQISQAKSLVMQNGAH